MNAKFPRSGEGWMNLVLFAATVFMAWWSRWRTEDLAWGLWIGSLILGSGFFLVSIAGNLMRKAAGDGFPAGKMKRDHGQNRMPGLLAGIVLLLILGLSVVSVLFFAVFLACDRIAAVPHILEKRGKPLRSPSLLSAIRLISGIPEALFYLVVFAIHFLGFHFVHGMFLNAFFPRVNPSGLFNCVEDGFQLYRTLLSGLLSQFALFILAGAVSRLSEYARAYRTRWPSMMFRPYVNVVRMHIMIILFGFLSAFKLEGVMLYLLLVIYFFPLSLLFRSRRAGKG